MRNVRQKRCLLKQEVGILPAGLSVERLKRAQALNADLRDLGFSIHWHVAVSRLFERAISPRGF